MSIYINEDCDKPGDCPAVDCEGRYDDDSVPIYVMLCLCSQGMLSYLPVLWQLTPVVQN